MWKALITLSCLVALAHGHGRLMDPPNRGSIWRFGYNSPANYDDDGLNCGGFYHQWSVNGGKCGVCGDPYDSPQPRAHELGGTYGKGYIVATYAPGDVITTNVYISAYHMGFWEFRICLDPYDNTQECFDQILLELEDGGTKYYPKEGSGTYEVNYRIPSNIVCEHCVLQWKYTAGNNWGVCENGTQGLGCGNQENFFSCSDIAIEGDAPYNTEAPKDVYTPVQSPGLELTGDLLRLLILTNEIQDVRPSYRDPYRKKYMNRHKRKKINNKKPKKRRPIKMYYR
ncbi:uncharacterized protein LOC124639190 [Helicoverpa zea]|uniref:uncharacterized protein LOC124639190 n=1 Tax=Helicoverpa zea TaxID=7113 RepID=UPI001F57BA7A|nr:uncharacterized protein LOC124639190 [Helicoverpa zea]